MSSERNALAALVQEVIRGDPFSGAAFLFTSKRRDRIKCSLVQSDRGQGAFPWPRKLEQDVLTLSVEQLNWLLDGYDVWKMKPNQTLYFSHAA